MSLSNFEIIGKLGEGSYSTVYKVVRKQDGIIYALKQVKFISMSPKEKQNTLNEIRILASLSHPNVVSYKEAFIDTKTDTLCLVMEFAEKGDLQQKVSLSRRNGVFFEESEIWKIAIELIFGLKALHHLKIMHRDIKCANIFLSENNTVKLGDLNVAKIGELARTETGTPYYASPEIWKDAPYDFKSDIWSLGCTLYEITALDPPFKAHSMKAVYRKVIMGKYPQIPVRYSEDLSVFISSMLQLEARNRPSCDELLEMVVLERHIPESSLVEPLTDELIKTIRLTGNMKALKTRLPAPKYSRRHESTHNSPDGFDKENKVQKRVPTMTPSPQVRFSSRSRRGSANIFKERILREIQHNKLPRA